MTSFFRNRRRHTDHPSVSWTIDRLILVDTSQLEEDVDLDCESGRKDYLERRKPNQMTKKAMETNKPWPKRCDGFRHASLPVSDRHCQCRLHQYTYDNDDSQREVNPMMQRNRAYVRRCLACNVNLCSICEIEFHRVRICESEKLQGNRYFSKPL
jgi:hypothetical protein